MYVNINNKHISFICNIKTAKVLIIEKIVKYLFSGFDLDFLWIELMKNLCLPNLFMVLI